MDFKYYYITYITTEGGMGWCTLRQQPNSNGVHDGLSLAGAMKWIRNRIGVPAMIHTYQEVSFLRYEELCRYGAAMEQEFGSPNIGKDKKRHLSVVPVQPPDDKEPQ